MEDTPNLHSKYRLGFRIALASHLKKGPPGVSSYDTLRRAWKARCFALANLSGQFPVLSSYLRFGARRASCDARDVFPKQDGGKRDNGYYNEEPIFRCHQTWVCPWCSTRPMIRVIRRVFRALSPAADRLKGYVWTSAGWRWDLGRLDVAVASRVTEKLEQLLDIRDRTVEAVGRNPTRSAAYVSRIRLTPGRPVIEGSPPALVLSYRCAFLARENALVPRRWSSAPSAEMGGAEEDDYGRGVSNYADLCRFLAAFPPGLIYARPVDLARLLSLKSALNPKGRVGQSRRRFNLVSLSLPRL